MFFASTGAVLETLGPLASDPAAHARWAQAVKKMCVALQLPAGLVVVRPHASGAVLAMEAPIDQLYVATEINEWAWESALGLIADPANPADPALAGLYADYAPSHAAVGEFDAAVALFRARAAAEQRLPLRALLARAKKEGLFALVDDDMLSIGSGNGSRCWPMAEVPAVDDVPWTNLHQVPTVLVTGSNGKTTTVRLLAAIARLHGQVVGYCCTEGVFVNGEKRVGGDYSGPSGARTVLRDPTVGLAVLETARGGLLRRGLACVCAQVAVVTNLSADHFGEYGVDSLDDLADAKLLVAHALGEHGLLVLNADDPNLMMRSAKLTCRVGLFAINYDALLLRQHRHDGGCTCGVLDGRLILYYGGAEYDLGSVAAMPLTVGGVAGYNIANIAGATLAAAGMGFKPDLTATVMARFGASRIDNPGRLERWNCNGVSVLIDYAHNPDGLAGLLNIANALRGEARIGLLLGQAGNRSDQAIIELAKAAADAKPDLVVLKDIPDYLRGRQPGEVPGILRAALIADGIGEAAIRTVLPDVEAACVLLGWAEAGDVIVLPVHDAHSRLKLEQLLDLMQERDWMPGDSLPALSHL